MISDVWEFLRDEPNREALKIIGGGFAALALAVWAIFQELRTKRRLNDLDAHLAAVRASQADILRRFERTDQRHDILIGAIVSTHPTDASQQMDDEDGNNASKT